jgi:hypothetical protein
MATKKKLLQAAAGNAGGGAGLDVEEVFSTFLYSGNGSTRTITNGIDLDGEGGLVWIKNRGNTTTHNLHDTERGAGTYLQTNASSAEVTDNDEVTAFNSNGFSLGDGTKSNSLDGSDYASWTFRKAPKFFDVQTFTYSSGSATTINHSLNCEVGMVIIKRTDSSDNWYVQHRSNTGSDSTGILNGTAAFNSPNGYSNWIATFGTTSLTTVTNQVSGTYVAYLFAHNDGDGEFGPDGGADIIKCGSFTTNASGDASIDLGFEPQWVLLKRTDAAQSWWLADTMRGMTVGTTGTAYLVPDQNYAEDSTYTNYINPTATGFSVDAFSGSADYIYIAIRRGPMAVPEDATDVFNVTTQSGSTAPAHDTGFVTDFSLRRENALSSASVIQAADRLRGKPYLTTEGTNSETNLNNNTWDFMDGWFGATSNDSNKYAWSWKRAPNYMECVAYDGDSTASPNSRDIEHNLGVAPEMMWIKCRTAAENWAVYHSGIGATKYLNLNNTTAAATSANWWRNTAPTDTVFTIGHQDDVNLNGGTHIAYLFATLAGISKVGSVTHSGTTNVDCGFTSGARFVLLKRTDATGDWYVWDSERGIVSGNDPYLLLNSTAAEVTNTDYIDPLSSGFTITSSFTAGDYIFYSIA